MMFVSTDFISYLPYLIHHNSSVSAVETRLSRNSGCITLVSSYCLLSFLTVLWEGMELFIFIIFQF
ncbi:hypothetical protein HNQ37_000389 [Lactovum miscens]|uniref:Uncharacterized protein n=1 Tax=Lactovum miscens TaxID=190387 RepID=A0A841C704_9LACT|nr:hypothetical protein [Lactovum miscens]